jgi:hypothetical protein
MGHEHQQYDSPKKSLSTAEKIMVCILLPIILGSFTYVGVNLYVMVGKPDVSAMPPTLQKSVPLNLLKSEDSDAGVLDDIDAGSLVCEAVCR